MSESNSTPARTGAWFIGALGSVATTATVGLHALRRGLVAPVGLTTETESLEDVPLVPLDAIVVGGHDVTQGSLVDKARRLAQGGMFSLSLVESIRDDLAETQERIRIISRRPTQQEDIEALAADITAFRTAFDLDTVVVVDVSSTEPLPEDHPAFHDEERLREALTIPGGTVLPPSAVAAAAAIHAGAAYAGFTPSVGLSLPSLRARAQAVGIPVAGQDGKTGETLLRTVLGPMFAARAFSVQSWAGTNLLGGGDGATLADPAAVQSKLSSKNRGLHSLLGEDVVTPLHIDNVPDLGDVKVAWDHVSAIGFLGSRVTLQTSWSAYDSTLAAPLVIDLVRLLTLAMQAGDSGVIRELGCFFKDPWGSDTHSFAEQIAQFQAWVHATGLRASVSPAIRQA